MIEKKEKTNSNKYMFVICQIYVDIIMSKLVSSFFFYDLSATEMKIHEQNNDVPTLVAYTQLHNVTLN